MGKCFFLNVRIGDDNDENSYKKVVAHPLKVIKSCRIIAQKLKNSAHSLKWKQTCYSTLSSSQDLSEIPFQLIAIMWLS